MKDGNGKLNTVDGYYEGQFKRNYCEGTGTYCWVDKRKYIGE